MNATPSRSCLIYGAPGTGKTHLAKWMAKEIQLPMVLAKLESIVSSFLGTSARNIGNLFKFANRYNCVLLLDEFDAIAKLRNDPQEVGEVKRIVNSLLQCLDERDSIGFTIGITNHEQLLDPAIWRRFDVQIDIPKPSNKVIQELLNAFLPPLEFSESELKFMSWCLNGATGADVEKWVNWLKRMKIINEYRHENLISLMRRYILLNTGRISRNVKDALDGPNEALYEILTGSDADLKKKDIASILNITPSSLSKQISKFKNV
jgi:SpoVK/Ycf46/Vps4 family AAA+-type ATPase